MCYIYVHTCYLKKSLMVYDCCLQLYLMFCGWHINTYVTILYQNSGSFLRSSKPYKCEFLLSREEKKETAGWANPRSDRVFQKLWFNATSNVWCCVSILCIASIMCRDSCCLVSQPHLFINYPPCTWPKFILRLVGAWWFC